MQAHGLECGEHGGNDFVDCGMLTSHSECGRESVDCGAWYLSVGMVSFFNFGSLSGMV